MPRFTANKHEIERLKVKYDFHGKEFKEVEKSITELRKHFFEETGVKPFIDWDDFEWQLDTFLVKVSKPYYDNVGKIGQIYAETAWSRPAIKAELKKQFN